MRPTRDRRGRFADFGDLVLGMAAEMAYVAAIAVAGAVVCAVARAIFLAAHA